MRGVVSQKSYNEACHNDNFSEKYHKNHPLGLDLNGPALGNHYVEGLGLAYDKELVPVFRQLSDPFVGLNDLSWLNPSIIESTIAFWVDHHQWKKVVICNSESNIFDIQLLLRDLGVDCLVGSNKDFRNTDHEYLKYEPSMDAFLFPDKQNTNNMVQQGWPREKIFELKTLLAVGINSPNMRVVFDLLVACKSLRKRFDQLSLYVPPDEPYGTLLAKCLYSLEPDLFDYILDYATKKYPSLDESETYLGPWSFYEKQGPRSAVVFAATRERFINRVSWCQHIANCSHEMTVFAPYTKVSRARTYQHNSPRPSIIWETTCTGSSRSTHVLLPMAELLGRSDLCIDFTNTSRMAWADIQETTKIARGYFSAMGLYHFGRTHIVPLDLTQFQDTPLKVVMCCRDPRDMLFSLFGYHYTLFYKRSIDYLSDEEVDTLIAIMQGSEIPRPNNHDKYYAHCINQFLIAQSMPNARLLRFEDVHYTPYETYVDIMKWLEWLPCSYLCDEEIETQLKQRIKITREQHWGNRRDAKGHPHSQLVIGKWKLWFPPRLIEAFKDIYGQALIDLGYEKDKDW